MLGFVLDSVLAALVTTARVQAYAANLQAICNELITLRPASAVCLARMGKVLEALGPVLNLAPALAPPIIEAFFGLLQSLHAQRGNAPVGNNDLAPYVREQRQLTKCYTTLSMKAPDAFVPYLDSIAERTLELVRTQVRA